MAPITKSMHDTCPCAVPGTVAARQHPESAHVPPPLQPFTILARCEMDGARHWTPHSIRARSRHHRSVAHHWTSVWVQRHLATGHQYWHHRDLLDGVSHPEHTEPRQRGCAFEAGRADPHSRRCAQRACRPGGAYRKRPGAAASTLRVARPHGACGAVTRNTGTDSPDVPDQAGLRTPDDESS